MHAPAFHCPACGGPQSHGGPGQCDFCGAVRVPLGVPDPRTAARCPECMSSIAGDHQFCPRCGSAQGEAEAPLTQSGLACPACQHTMAIWGLDPSLGRVGGQGAIVGYRGSDPQILGCQRCGGAWVDRSTLNAIIDEAQAQAHNTDDQAVPRQTMAMVDVVIYRPCPCCNHRMNRRNFGRYSGIVVDECHGCGTFFDAGELEGVVAFVRGGGLGLTERRDARARQQRREPPTPIARYQPSAGFGALGWEGGSLVLVIGLLRWLGRWIRKHRQA